MSGRHPTVIELIEAVRGFLSERAVAELHGHAAFHARVAVNALDVVLRELRPQENALRAERRQLEELLGDGPTSLTIEELERRLSMAIRNGSMTFDTPGLTEYLWATTWRRLAIDQPRYRPREGAGTPPAVGE